VRVRRNHARYKRIKGWLQQAGVRNDVTRTHIAIDLADLLDASAQIRLHLDQMLGVVPSSPRAAHRALRHAVSIEVHAFTELKDHLARRERNWESRVEKALMETIDNAHHR
jgi:hypothetical protein